MKQLTIQQTKLVAGGRQGCSADDRSDCRGEREGPRGGSESYTNRERYKTIVSDIGSAALGIAGGYMCGTVCSAAGGFLGSRLGSFYGGIAHDNPGAFRHPEYPDSTWPRPGKSDR